MAEISVTIDELRALAHGLRPAALDAGLGPALRDLARRAPLPVDVDTDNQRSPPEIETIAYFCACEGLTNAVKHARAARVVLSARANNGMLVLSVADDGVGGAATDRGSGLTGLSDRVAAGGSALDPAVVANLVSPATGSPIGRLSERERGVLGLMAEGLTNSAIAGRLVVSERTVEAHVRHFLTKLDIAETDDAQRRVIAVLTYLDSLHQA